MESVINENEISYEKAYEEINEIVEKIEKGDITLDESIKAYSRAIVLVAFCNNKLDAAQKSIDRLLKVLDDKTDEEAKPFSPELSFEEAYNEAERLNSGLSAGEYGVEESLQVFSKIDRLIVFCYNKLNQARQQMCIIERDENGSFAEVPFSRVENNN